MCGVLTGALAVVYRYGPCHRRQTRSISDVMGKVRDRLREGAIAAVGEIDNAKPMTCAEVHHIALTRCQLRHPG